MKPFTLVLAAGLAALMTSPALAAEQCKVASTGAGGEPRYTDISLDLAAKLDPAALPERASAVMCLRSSIVPRPDDVRVLSEWGVSFGIAEQGPRVLWISVRAGTLQVRIDHGGLSVSERAAVKQWRKAAQIRYLLGLVKPKR